MEFRRGRVFAALAVVVAVLVCLAGCDLVGEPSSTESLLVRYAANENNENFVAEAHVDAALALAGYRTGVPVVADVKAAGGSAHGTIVVDMSDIDKADSQITYELYVEQQGTAIVWYVGESAGGDTTWTRSEVDLSFTLDVPSVVELLSDARFMRIAYESDPEVAYELTLPAAGLLKTVLGKGDVTTSFGTVDTELLFDVLGDSRVHVCFDKDCLMHTVTLDLDFSYEDKGLLPVSVGIDLDCSALLHDYGTVDAQEVAVPDEVSQQAQPTDDPLDLGTFATKLDATIS